jgi:hypothetical protein
MMSLNLLAKGRARALESKWSMKTKTRKSSMSEPVQLRAIELRLPWILTFKLFSKAFASLALALIYF